MGLSKRTTMALPDHREDNDWRMIGCGK